MKKKGRSIGQLAEEHQRLSDAWDELEVEQKKLEKDMDAVALEAQAAMEAAGTVDGTTPGGVEYELKDREHLNVKDFDKLWKWCLETKRFVFQRRIGVEAYRDYVNAGIRVPGVTIFKKPEFKTKRKKVRA